MSEDPSAAKDVGDDDDDGDDNDDNTAAVNTAADEKGIEGCFQF